MTARSWTIGALAAALLAFAAQAQPAPQCPAGIRLLGEATLPHRMDFQGTVVGGLSGLAYDRGSDSYLALADDRSELSPARFYRLKASIGADGKAKVDVIGVTTLTGPDGKPYPARAVDPEAIALLPDGRILWGTEAHPADRTDAALILSTAEGREIRTLPLPGHYRTDATVGWGSRDNLGFEGIALLPDGKTLAAAVENALAQDGPVASLAEESPARVLLIDIESGRPPREVVYPVGRIPAAPPEGNTGRPDNGISDIVVLDADTLLMQERSFIPGRGNIIRLYTAKLSGAADVKAIDSLKGRDVVPMEKALFLDFACFDTRLDNFEGLAWGPMLPDGKRLLFAVSDDNFSKRQVTKFLLIEVTP